MDSTYYYALGSGAAALFAIPRLWDMFTKRMIEKESGFYDAERLGRQRDSVHKISGTAVVCGGSIAGLLTARICHDHFEHVVIVESENWLDTEDARLVHSWDQQSTRSRIMQYTSIQGNLPILYKGLSHLFPNFDAECEASDIGLDAADYKLNFFGYLALAPAEHYGGQLPKTFFSSRRALETLLRRLILDPAKYPNIKQVIGTVTGLLVNSAHPEKRISAAVVRDRDGVSQQISSSLLIDCTGPTQAGTKWLQRLEYAQDLKRDTFHANMHYRTFHFHISPELGAKLPIPGGYENIGGSIIVRVPDNSRDRLYLAVSKGEGRTIAVCCGSWGIDDLPSTVDGIKELGLAIQHDQPLPSWFPPFLDMLHEAEDTMEFSSVHVGPAYWTHYERSPDLPTNFVAIGDSVSRINPIYGQGCSKALVGAMVMNTILEQHRNEPRLPNEFARTVFQSQADKIKPLWDSTKAIDYAHHTTLPMEGETLEHGWFIRWFSHKMQILAASDRQAASAMWRNVVMMDGASIEMMHPMLLLKVFWLAFFRRK